ncbi:MAG: glycosyltransferase family 4 protein [bacterium]|nr:glycosyltransferase family 4 protein [bacterium]
MSVRVVIPQKPGINSYLELLGEALAEEGWTVEYAFPPNPDSLAPITWIHWPEQLTDYQRPSADDVERIGAWLQASARQGVLVWTVHNTHRHGMPDDPGFRALYELTARHAQVHLHHGHRSVERVRAEFPAAEPIVTSVFRHGGYWDLLGEHTRESARASLGIAPDARVLLVFGQVRESREYMLALRAARVKGWRVLVAGQLPRVRRRERPGFWLAVRRAGDRFEHRAGPFEPEQVDRLVKAADAVLIPRYECLNSGNVFLGFTFSLPVLGPDVGNVGEVLRETGNPLFEPGRAGDLERALLELSHQDGPALGRRNANWLEQNCQWEQAARIAIDAIGRVRAEASVASKAIAPENA